MDEDGTYRAGPFEADFKYEIIPAKEDFSFVAKEGSPRDFTSQKLSKLEVVVVNEETGALLEDVFLSLSAGETRLTSKTDAFGSSKFSNLKP